METIKPEIIEKEIIEESCIVNQTSKDGEYCPTDKNPKKSANINLIVNINIELQ